MCMPKIMSAEFAAQRSFLLQRSETMHQMRVCHNSARSIQVHFFVHPFCPASILTHQVPERQQPTVSATAAAFLA